MICWRVGASLSYLWKIVNIAIIQGQNVNPVMFLVFMFLFASGSQSLLWAMWMDGNGRWATQRGKPRIEGHRVGVQSVKAIVDAARELGIEVLTLYAFSSENWRRPAPEIKALMTLLREYLKWELHNLNDLNIRLKTIGRTEELAPQVQEQLNRTIEQTESNTGMVLNLALNYGSRHEILDAIKKMYSDMDTKDIDILALTPEMFEQYLSTADLPDLDLLIQTSGEMRVSNFLLWQLAYAELYVTSVLWPDFRKPQFYEAILDFQLRERRFGKTSEQCR